MTIKQSVQEIRQLHPTVRIAGYIARAAKINELGAKLRTVKQDEEWTEEESKNWEDLCSDLDPWWIALSQQEKEYVVKFDEAFGAICRGEDLLK
jgi:hypothetical protein